MSNIDLSEEKPSKTIGRVTSFNLKEEYHPYQGHWGGSKTSY
jgi:hypothetical protein